MDPYLHPSRDYTTSTPDAAAAFERGRVEHDEVAAWYRDRTLRKEVGGYEWIAIDSDGSTGIYTTKPVYRDADGCWILGGSGRYESVNRYDAVPPHLAGRDSLRRVDEIWPDGGA